MKEMTRSLVDFEMSVVRLEMENSLFMKMNKELHSCLSQTTSNGREITENFAEEYSAGIRRSFVQC